MVTILINKMVPPMAKLNAKLSLGDKVNQSAWRTLVLVPVLALGGLLMVFSAHLVAADTDGSIAVNPEAVFQSQCASCHGNTAKGTVLAPALAGQQSAYIQRQLMHFKNGLRGKHSTDSYGAQMLAIATALEAEAISQLAAYLSELDANKSSTTSATADLRKGYTYYHSTCGGCHGGQAEGNSMLNAPRLNTLSAEYLHRQLDYFAKGVRGAHKEDRFGRQMAMMSKSLDAKTLADVIAFITTQPK